MFLLALYRVYKRIDPSSFDISVEINVFRRFPNIANVFVLPGKGSNSYPPTLQHHAFIYLFMTVHVHRVPMTIPLINLPDITLPLKGGVGNIFLLTVHISPSQATLTSRIFATNHE